MLRKKGLRNWDDNIEKNIKDKREAYKKFLSSRKDVDKIEYNLKRAIAKWEVRKYHQKNWEKFVSFLENNITRPQPQIYKVLKILGSDIKDTKLNLISPDAWLKHYQNLWGNKSSPLKLDFSDNLEEESITLEELMETMAKIKNNKTPC